MDQASNSGVEHGKVEHARDLQATLYREIGISAVAAALRFTTQPEPAEPKDADGNRSRGQARFKTRAA